MNQQSSENAYRFEPVTQADYLLLRQWLETPEVRDWWGDPNREINLIKGDRDDDRMANYMVSFAGRVFAYAQHYDVSAWPQDHFDHLPAGTRAIDTFIGDSEMMGAGHGSAYLRQLANTLIADGCPEVVIDPNATNVRARRSFEKAGFTRTSQFETADGPTLVMLFAP